jgi:hypothetical protein
MVRRSRVMITRDGDILEIEYAFMRVGIILYALPVRLLQDSATE